MKNIFNIKILIIIFLSLFFLSSSKIVYASEINNSNIINEDLDSLLEIPSSNSEQGILSDLEKPSTSIKLLYLVTLISVLPSILIMLTCFTRIIIVLGFLRNALGTQQMPPNQVMIGLALFLTFFIMGPIFNEINETAITPYSESKITQEEALEIGMEPIRGFMFKQVRNEDVALFLELSGETINSKEELPNKVLIPSFILGELTKGFQFGVILYIPFIVIDMVVSSILMAMGMMMLPPSMISMPFKILVFILAGGWNLVIENLIKSFRF